MSIDNSTVVICYDVDGTLITLDNKPRHDVIKTLFMFRELGCKIYVWSGGGIDYATQWVNRLGLPCEVIAKGSILPSIAFDDQLVGLGEVSIQV